MSSRGSLTFCKGSHLSVRTNELFHSPIQAAVCNKTPPLHIAFKEKWSFSQTLQTTVIVA